VDDLLDVLRSPVEELVQAGRVHELVDLVHAEVPPFLSEAQPIHDAYRGPCGLAQSGDDIRADEAGSSGDNDHGAPCGVG
jgi:hypothetical protein